MAQQLKDKIFFFRCLFMALCDYTEHDTLSLENLCNFMAQQHESVNIDGTLS